MSFYSLCYENKQGTESLSAKVVSNYRAIHVPLPLALYLSGHQSAGEII